MYICSTMMSTNFICL